MKQNENQCAGAPQHICPDCESRRIKTAMEEDSFSYGLGVDAIHLKAAVPVHRCDDCKFAFTDGEADLIRHNAICAHLGLLNPEQVSAVRRQCKMGLPAFGKLSGLSDTSLARLEAGGVLPTAAEDALLYLLTFPENVERLKRRRAAAERRRRAAKSE